MINLLTASVLITKISLLAQVAGELAFISSFVDRANLLQLSTPLLASCVAVGSRLAYSIEPGHLGMPLRDMFTGAEDNVESLSASARYLCLLLLDKERPERRIAPAAGLGCHDDDGDKENKERAKHRSACRMRHHNFSDSKCYMAMYADRMQ
jgi:hypothetical protein